jgi:hypothetical protein
MNNEQFTTHNLQLITHPHTHHHAYNRAIFISF